MPEVRPDLRSEEQPSQACRNQECACWEKTPTGVGVPGRGVSAEIPKRLAEGLHHPPGSRT